MEALARVTLAILALASDARADDCAALRQFIEQAPTLTDALLTDAYAEGRRDEQQELASVLPGSCFMREGPDGA
jgi:hypothetical protein